MVVTSTKEQRLAWIEEAKELCRRAFGLCAHNNTMDSDDKMAPIHHLDAAR